ncbi:MAG TPA: hypothetical protein ENL00_04105 [Nitratifractor sp.]|nr:hypothetical protein [Nitratifractor sp.]
MKLEPGVKFKMIEGVIKKHGSFINDIRIIDFYQRPETLKQEALFTLRLFYQSEAKTLTAAEVDKFNTAIRKVLAETKGVALR